MPVNKQSHTVREQVLNITRNPISEDGASPQDATTFDTTGFRAIEPHRLNSFGSRKLPDPPIKSGRSRPSTGGSLSITLASSTSHPIYETGSYNRDSIDSHFRDISSKSVTGPRKHVRGTSYRSVIHDWSRDDQEVLVVASTPSKSSFSNNTLWSRASLASSRTSFASALSHVTPPKLDLEIPSCSLSVGSHLLSSPDTSAKPEIVTVQDSNQATLPQTTEIPSQVIHDEPLQSLQASDQETSVDLDRNPEISFQNRFQQLSPIQQAIQSPFPIYHVRGGAVMSGTLEGLVQFIVTGFGTPGHHYYRDAFLTACSQLTTPEDLFRVLSRRLYDASDEGFGTQSTIFLVIIYWVKSDYFSLNEELLYRIKFFCEDAMSQYVYLEAIANETRQLVEVTMARLLTQQAPMPQETILKSSEIKPHDLAVALGLLEGDNYKCLKPSDYLLYLSKDRPDRVQRYLKTNEKIRLWVIRSILYFDTVSHRSEVMKFFINAALECYSMRNFSSTTAISTALHSFSIECLKATNKATRKALNKKTLAKFPILSDIIDTELNHKRYYNMIQSATNEAERDTCIPYLPIHFKELDIIISQPPTIRVDGQNLVNFARYSRFMDRTREILPYSPPDLEDKRHGGQLTYLLNQLHDIDLSGDLERQLSAKGRSLSARESSSNSIVNENLRRAGFVV